MAKEIPTKPAKYIVKYNGGNLSVVEIMSYFSFADKTSFLVWRFDGESRVRPIETWPFDDWHYINRKNYN